MPRRRRRPSRSRACLLAPGTYVVAVTGDAGRPAAVGSPGPDPRSTGISCAWTDPRRRPRTSRPSRTTTRRSPRFDPSIVMHGRGAAGDRDVFRVTVEGEPQLWEAEATGPAVERLDWIRGRRHGPGRGQAGRGRGAGARSTDLYLVPGEHLLAVAGAGEYELRLTPLGPPDPDAEREPNNDTAFAEPLASRGRGSSVGCRRRATGMSSGSRSPGRSASRSRSRRHRTARSTCASRRGGSTVARVRPPDAAREPTRPAARPGRLRDRPRQRRRRDTSTGRYELRLERGDPFALRDDAEPNDIIAWASPDPAQPDRTRLRRPVNGDVDWYALPAVEPGRRRPGDPHWRDRRCQCSPTGERSPRPLDPATGVLAADGGLGLAPRFLRVFAYGDYEAVVEVDGLEPPVPNRSRSRSAWT